MGVSSCTGPKEWKGVADCNAGGRAHSETSIFSGLYIQTFKLK